VDNDVAEQGTDYTITHPEILAMSQAYQEKFVHMYLEVLRKDKKLTQSKRMQALRKSWEQKLIYQFIVNDLQKKLAESAGKDKIIATLQADVAQEKLKVDHRSIQAK
jgi:translation initiation factor 2 beta subunit (eIF-2beta)/eIF-5